MLIPNGNILGATSLLSCLAWSGLRAAQKIVVAKRVVLQSRLPMVSRLWLQDIVERIVLLSRHGGPDRAAAAIPRE